MIHLNKVLPTGVLANLRVQVALIVRNGEQVVLGIPLAGSTVVRAVDVTIGVNIDFIKADGGTGRHLGRGCCLCLGTASTKHPKELNVFS